MGHEMTGEVVEAGSDVEFLHKGDIVSVPFNVGRGRCYNCKHMRTDVLGYGAIIVADYLPDRLALLEPHGIETIDLNDGVAIEDHLRRITGRETADRVIDYVGVDCRGFGSDAARLVEDAVTNALLKYVSFGGTTSTVGVYCANPLAESADYKKGSMEIEWAGAWIKSPRMAAGQSPTMSYNHGPMEAILHDRMPYLTPMLNTTVITMDEVPEAYKVFAEGSPSKYVIDPHGSVKGGVPRGLNPGNLSMERFTPLAGKPIALGVSRRS